MKNLPLPILLLALGACAGAPPEAEPTPTLPTTAWSGRVQGWGTLREALRDGRTQGRVAVADVARPGVYAVGALEGLRGEVTIVDGDVWMTEGGAERVATSHGHPGSARATVLFAADVTAWRDVPVDEDVEPDELDAFVVAAARAAGLDPSQPFPFLVEGGLRHLELHVVAGECPIRARALDREMTAPPYELRADAADGRLVGIHAPDSAGIVCHLGSESHVHAVLPADGGLTGHVEAVGLAAGSVLKLPAPAATSVQTTVSRSTMKNDSTLTKAEEDALRAALDDEYRAWATYDQVLHDFGPVRPFSNIVGAEARHIEALHTLFERYGVPIPENPYPGDVPRYASVGEACEAAVTAEIENAELYERLLAATTHPDVRTVFLNLQAASQERHLRAFRRCAARRGG